MTRKMLLPLYNQRLNGKDPIDISNALLKEYQIQTYPGDIFSWLDAYVRNLDAIRRIAKHSKSHTLTSFI